MTTSEPSHRPRRTPTDGEIPSLLAALAVSGGNTAAFAREHGLAPWKLYEARRVAAGGARRRKPRRRRKDGRELVPVHVLEERQASSVPLEVVLGSGHRLLIPCGFDEPTLRRVMGVLATC